jgi:hypothetical protein
MQLGFIHQPELKPGSIKMLRNYLSPYQSAKLLCGRQFF